MTPLRWPPTVTSTTAQLLRVGGLLLFAGLAIVLAGRWAENRELQLKADTLRQAAEVYTLGLHGITEKYRQLPYTAARHPDVLALLRRPTDAALVGRVNAYLQDVQQRTESAALYVMDARGVTLAASNWQTAASFVGQSYAQRPYVEQALQGSSSFFYGVGLTTGAAGLFFAEPVRDQGRVMGVMAVKLGLDELQATWSKVADPVLLRDSRGIVFLSSVPDWLYRSQRPLSTADLAWLRRRQQYGERTGYEPLPWVVQPQADGLAGYRLNTDLRGQRRSLLALDTPVPELGWTLTVTSDLAEVLQARDQARALAALAAAVLLLAVLYWQQRERRFAEQRRAREELEQRVRERTHDLQEAHAFRKAMEDSLLVGMRARDPQGRIIYVNPALCEMTGYSADELLGSTQPYPYWHPDDMEKHWRESEAALQGRAAPHGFESRIRHRDGHDVITMVYTAPLVDADGRHQGWMSSVVDITAQKKAEAREREQEQQLQRSARLASLGEMASTLAHELNQPLMALSNFALAARAMAAEGRQALLAPALDDIVAQARRASDIVQRIRGFIRPQRGGHEACDLHAVLAQVLVVLAPELQRHQASVNTQLAEPLPLLRGDQVLLQQVLVNLLQNAMQATQPQPPAQRQIDVQTRVLAGAVELVVCDRGPGIPSALREQVFMPFFSTKDDGLGLGLAICRTIVEAHGGILKLAEREGGGACFSFSLPLAPS